jgi:FkbM family methyltransferase
LKDAGFTAVKVIYKYDLEAGPYIRSSNLKDLAQKAEHARSLLSDSKSKMIFNSIIARSSGADNDLMLMPSICENNQYFPTDLFDLSCEESYVDVGAYDGDTIKKFLSKCKNQFDKIYAFELNNNIFSKLENNLLNLNNVERIKIFNVGAWDKKEKLSYKEGNSNSAIGEGAEIAFVAPLDEMLSDVKVTYLKMDIEGAEINALCGARKLIEKQKPKLAICVYHKISHLWEIPILINEMLPDHSIFLRHHTNLEYETVCYALPNNIFTNKL